MSTAAADRVRERYSTDPEYQAKKKAANTAWRKANPEKAREAVRRSMAADRLKYSLHIHDYRERCRGRYPEQTKIRPYRKALGLSQKKTAALLGVGQSTLYNWEEGIFKACWDKLEAVFPGIKQEVYTK